jgi:hypothetical protein
MHKNQKFIGAFLIAFTVCALGYLAIYIYDWVAAQIEWLEYYKEETVQHEMSVHG